MEPQSKTQCAALLVAAGRGHRVGGPLPKQYVTIGGESVLRHAARRFLAHPEISSVLVVIHPDDRALYEAAIEGLDLPAPVMGGAERQDSVRNGLEQLARSGAPKAVLIHDAVRPFVDARTISAVIGAIREDRGALPALPVADTLKRAEGGIIQTTVDRSALWRAQTPQGFPFAPLLAAHRAAKGKVLTDDAAVAEAAGLAVAIVPGHETNFKITGPDDMERAERMLNPSYRVTRVGTGFDVHAFEDGDFAIICGIEIPHTHKLKGHSDADVGLHAITDALLGAAGKGDIGVYFPPSDAKWRGAPSDIFLKAAGDMILADGGRIENIDITVICESPKVGPHREKMRARVAEILSIPVERVNVKGKTTEKLGFLGRSEGIAAQASASVSYPASS
jgi:2-C-methyl-D-erythritol 4-phosphate cytidylyltransferase/2-C-methyl-D-erythritol 2,4-cyclodiphosphate synthase